MENLHMYLLVFKKPSKSQIAIIRNIFSDFDWGQGFDVEEVVVNEVINDNLLIQFVSFKEFFQNENNEITLYPLTVDAVLSGKGQFLGTLLDSAKEIDKLDTYFCYLGIAADNRDEKNEIAFKVEYGKYSSLNKIDLALGQLINS